MTVEFILFETAIGRCGVAWGRRGIVAVQLPEPTDSETRRRLARRGPNTREAPAPPDVWRAIDSMTALLRGEAVDLSFAILDMSHLPPFHRRVYSIARTIPSGATLTYGAIAARLASPEAPSVPDMARKVGRALGQNPFPLIVPCHRVVAANGKAGGFSAPGGVATKLRLLAIEGARTDGAPSLFDAFARSP